MILLVVVSSEMVACGGRNGRQNLSGFVAVVGAVTFSSTGEDDRSEGTERKMPVVLRRAVGGCR